MHDPCNVRLAGPAPPSSYKLRGNLVKLVDGGGGRIGNESAEHMAFSWGPEHEPRPLSNLGILGSWTYVQAFNLAKLGHLKRNCSYMNGSQISNRICCHGLSTYYRNKDKN